MLVDSILSDQCTPFLGAGIGRPHLPVGRELAADLAKAYEYPFDDIGNLPRVAQFVATTYDPPYAKRLVQRKIRDAQEACMDASGQIAPVNYRILASMRFPLFITTNYDDLLERALMAANRPPRVEICRWNQNVFDDYGKYAPGEISVEHPGVFHMHGALSSAASLLVTEDDYVDFTVRLALEDHVDVLWHHVRRRMGGQNSLLFLGYSLEDWNFRVLMRYLLLQQKLHRSQQASNLSIQLPNSHLSLDKRRKSEAFLQQYFQNSSAIVVHWTDVSDFLAELGERVARERR